MSKPSHQDVPRAPQATHTVPYDSNPFTLSFNALSRFFKYNTGWAIALIILGFVSFVGQAGSDIIRYIAEPESSTEVTQVTPSLPSAPASSGPEIATIIAIAVIVFVVIVFAILIGSVISTFINGMFTYAALKSEEEQSVSFNEALQATVSRFWRLLFAQLLANIKIFGWTLLLIVPGIIAGYRYQLLPYLIMNESADEKGIGDSHTKIKALVKGRLWEVFGISFVAGLIPFVGSILGLTGKAAMHKQLQATSTHPELRPHIHWANYLCAGLVALFMAVSLLLIGIIIVILVA